MTRYVVLLRGINVGGRNKIAMGALKRLLEEMGFEQVVTYIQSGNVLLSSRLGAAAIARQIEQRLGEAFKFDSELIKVLALSGAQLQAIVDNRPKGFGDAPGAYHNDAIFLMGIGVKDALGAFSPARGGRCDLAGQGHHLFPAPQCPADREPAQPRDDVAALQIDDDPELANGGEADGDARQGSRRRAVTGRATDPGGRACARTAARCTRQQRTVSGEAR